MREQSNRYKIGAKDLNVFCDGKRLIELLNCEYGSSIFTHRDVRNN